MPTKARIARVESVLSHRWADLRVVFEDIRNTHNASAVVRTCDAAGIHYVDIISPENDPFPVNEAISTRAEKWLHFRTFSSTRQCLRTLKNEGYAIAATYLGRKSVPYTEVDWTRPTAVLFGNEAEGISPQARRLADHLIQIPMKGMVRSLNLSVSVGIILYEAIRQRLSRPEGRPPGLPEEEYSLFRNRWLGLNGDTD